MEKSIYIILSQSGTIISRTLKFFTRDDYNHVSISLTPTLDKMYSFGRINPRIPFPGGFVEEGKDKGLFKKCSKTKAIVMEIKVSEEKYKCIQYFISYFQKHKEEFRYNYLGVLMALFKKHYTSKKRFYCSEFVKECLRCFDIGNSNDLPTIVKPIDFLKLDNKNIIYTGLLQNYSEC